MSPFFFLFFVALGASCPVDDFTLSEVMAGAPHSHLLAPLLSSAPVAAAVISLAPSVDWYFVEGFVWIPSKNSAYLVKRKRKKLINSYSGPLPRPPVSSHSPSCGDIPTALK